MLKRFFNILAKEIKMGVRAHFLLMAIGLALFYCLLIAFVIPEDTNLKPDVFVFNEGFSNNPTVLEKVLGTKDLSNPKLHIVDSREELVEGMKENFNSVGIIIKNSDGQLILELVFQGHENAQVRELMKLSLIKNLSSSSFEENTIKKIELDENSTAEKIPANKWILPVLLLSEAVMLGSVLVFAMIFIEKSERTFVTFLVTPGKIAEYLGAKVAFLALLGVLFSIILTPMVVGFGINYLQLFAVIILGSLFSTSISLIVASFYKNLSQATISMIGLNLFFCLPVISYFVPGFSPWVVKILPTYPVLFAMRDIIFPGVASGHGLSGMLSVLIVGIIAFAVAVKMYKIQVSRG